MKTDIATAIGAVTRTVTESQRDGQTVRSVIAERSYAGAIEDVWDAITSAERLPRWFLPITGELKLGGRYQFQGNAGGTITACDPPHSLSATWEFGGGVSWVTVRLTPDGDSATRLTLEHTAPIDPHWGDYGPGAVGVGWELGLRGLAEHLETRAAVDPAQAQAWSMSDEGKAFIRGSAAGWGEAEAAMGEERAVATARAERTAKFYTGG